MKTIVFVSTNRVLFQGVKAVLGSRPELDFTLIPSDYHTALDSIGALEADAAVIDATDGALAQESVALCCEVRALENGRCKCLILVQQQNAEAKELVVKARADGVADDFVFYDSSMDYVLAKLAAL